MGHFAEYQTLSVAAQAGYAKKYNAKVDSLLASKPKACDDAEKLSFGFKKVGAIFDCNKAQQVQQDSIEHYQTLADFYTPANHK